MKDRGRDTTFVPGIELDGMEQIKKPSEPSNAINFAPFFALDIRERWFLVFHSGVHNGRNSHFHRIYIPGIFGFEQKQPVQRLLCLLRANAGHQHNFCRCLTSGFPDFRFDYLFRSQRVFSYPASEVLCSFNR